MKQIALLISLTACATLGLHAQEETPALPEAAASPTATPAPVDPEDQTPAAGAPPASEQPSAELIIDAEEAVAQEPGLPAGEAPRRGKHFRRRSVRPR